MMTFEKKDELAAALATAAVTRITEEFKPTERHHGRHVLDLLILKLQHVVEIDDQMTRDKNYKPSPPALEGEDA